MLDPRKIEQLARQVQDAIPKGVRDLGSDIEKKIRQVLQAQLAKLDLVNRQEFDLQTRKVDHLREQLAHLEQQVSRLEANADRSSEDRHHQLR